VAEFRPNFVGNGFNFPIETSPQGEIEKLKSETPENQAERIKQSVFQILSTRVGERFFLRDFGSRLHELVFEPNDIVLVGMARRFVIEAIEKWEKRIIIQNVEIRLDRDNSMFFVWADYVIRSTNVAGNLVFPFFLS